MNRQMFQVMVRRTPDARDDSVVLESRWARSTSDTECPELFELGKRLGQLVRGWAEGTVGLTQLEDGFRLGLRGRDALAAMPAEGNEAAR